MNGIALGTGSLRRLSADTQLYAIILALAAVACLQLGLAFSKSVNWDEFFHFSIVHADWRGEDIGSVLQRPFLPLFNWVPSLPGTNIEHIHLIRSLILPFEILLVGAITVSAAKFTDRQTALLCGLAYLTAGYAFTQGLALRADVISASLVMCAIAIGLHGRLNPLTLAVMGILTFLALISTIKVVLYLPVFLALAYVRRGELGRWVWVVPVVGLAGIGLAAVAAPELFEQIERTFAKSFDRMFGGGFFPQGMHWVRQSASASVFTVLTLGFAVWLVKGKSPHKPALALLALPALWPVIYFNSYPYFFAFILPPVAVAIAPVIALAVQRYGALALTAVFTLNAAALFVMEPRAAQANQVEVQELVREAFPSPVTYIDESGMIGNFPRAVPRFASGWALSAYRERGEPAYSEAMMATPVPLLLTNCVSLYNVFADAPLGERLLPEDEAILRANFIPHAGIVMVAGKQLEPSSELKDELVAVPGDYRVEGGAILIDGTVHPAGSVVALERARYQFRNIGADTVTLRWAQAGVPQASDITVLDLYSGY